MEQKDKLSNSKTEKSAYVLNPNSTPQQTQKLLKTSMHNPWDGNMTKT